MKRRLTFKFNILTCENIMTLSNNIQFSRRAPVIRGQNIIISVQSSIANRDSFEIFEFPRALKK